MAANGSQKFRTVPRSKSGGTIKHYSQTHSRSKEQHSAHTLKSETSHRDRDRGTSVPRNHLYFPLKELRLDLNHGKPEENSVNSNFLNSSRKGWETRISEKNRGQVRKRPLSNSNSSSVYLDPWAKYETFQNSKNVINTTSKNPPVSGINVRWNNASINGASQNLNMVTYNGQFRKEPSILESHLELPHQIQNAISQKKSTDADRKPTYPKSNDTTTTKTDLYAELMKFLTDDWSARIEDDLKKKLNPPSPSPTPRKLKSVSFAPETVFYERNMNSSFWREIKYNQQLRLLQRRQRAAMNMSKVQLTKVNSDFAKTGSTLSLAGAPGPNASRQIRHRKSKSNSNGFWSGLGKAISNMFACQSQAKHLPRRRLG